MRFNPLSSNQLGFSLVEVMVALGVSLISTAALISLNVMIVGQGRRVERSISLEVFQQELYLVVNERADVKEMLQHPDNQSYALTGCIFNPSIPCEINDGPNHDGWKRFKGFRVNRDTAGNVLYPLLPLETVFDPTIPNTNGFRANGSACNTFDATNGSDTCPFRYVLWWKPSCTAQCTSPQTVLVQAKLEYKPLTPAIALNPDLFTLHLAIAIAPPQGAQLAGVYQTTCLLYADGSVKCWGNNDWGNLGQNFIGPFLSGPHNFPHEMGPDWVKGFDCVSKFLGAIKLVDAYGTFCALMSDQRVTCWGDNTFGQVGIGVLGGALGGTGKGMYFHPLDYVKLATGGDLTGVVDIFAGRQSVCAQKSDGKIFCWGDIRAGMDVCKADETVSGFTKTVNNHRPTWGWTRIDQFPQVTTVNYPYWTDPTVGDNVGTTYNYSYATEMVNATVAEALGPGQIFAGSGAATGAAGCTKPASYVKFYKGSSMNCFLQASPGKAICWGSNSKGQLGATAAAGSSLLMNSNYYLPDVGQMNTSLVASNAPPMSNIVDLELGNDNTPCALLSTGNVVCWGSAGGWWADFNGHTGRGYLGNGVPVASIPDDVDTNPAFQFIPPSYVIDSTGVAGSKLSGVKKLSASDYNICALKQNGEVYCWGLNSYGVIGNSGYDMDTVRDVSVPTKVLLPEPVVQVRVLQHHACALTATNKVYCWGGNSCGELGYDPAQVALGITDYPLVRWGGPWRLNTPVPGGAL